MDWELITRWRHQRRVIHTGSSNRAKWNRKKQVQCGNGEEKNNMVGCQVRANHSRQGLPASDQPPFRSTTSPMPYFQSLAAQVCVLQTCPLRSLGDCPCALGLDHIWRGAQLFLQHRSYVYRLLALTFAPFLGLGSRFFSHAMTITHPTPQHTISPVSRKISSPYV